MGTCKPYLRTWVRLLSLYSHIHIPGESHLNQTTNIEKDIQVPSGIRIRNQQLLSQVPWSLGPYWQFKRSISVYLSLLIFYQIWGQNFAGSKLRVDKTSVVQNFAWSKLRLPKISRGQNFARSKFRQSITSSEQNFIGP